MHWAFDYIGKPWRLGGIGPEDYYCWGLVRAALRDHYAIDVPIIDVPAVTGIAVIRESRRLLAEHPELSRWTQVASPRDGDGVQMSRARDPWHVGLWLDVDGGGVLHCLEGAGVMFNSLSALKVAGWGRISYWRFTG